MHPYLLHLLQDIHEAHRDIPSPRTTESPGAEENDTHLREIDRWISRDAEHTLGYYCGLHPEDFPPRLQFAEGEIQRVCQAFEKMLVSWGIALDIPRALPLGKRYELMVGLLDETFTPVTIGTFVFDFCTGYAPGCALKEHCRCLEYWKD